MALRSRIPLIIKELDPKLREGIAEIAEQIAEAARERVPVDSGALQQAIHVDEEGDGISVVAGDDDAFYGHIIEHGGVNTPARPFLIPAFESERPKLEGIVGEKLRDL